MQTPYCPYLYGMLDIIVLVVAALGFLRGYSKGLIKSLFGLISIVLGIIIALKVSPYIIDFIEDAFKLDPRWALIIGFLLTLGLVIAALSYIAKLLEGILRSIRLNVINKLAGGLLYGLLFLLVLGLAYNFLFQIDVIKLEQIEKSQTYSLVTVLPREAQGVWENVRPAFEEFWERAQDVMNSNEE